MKEFEAKSLDEIEFIANKALLSKVKNGVDYMYFFRGQASDEFKLTPGITRYKHSIEKTIFREKKLFEEYKRFILKGLIPNIQEPYGKNNYEYIYDWFILFQAQHLGLRTRLIDWTIKWEVALYHAVNEKFENSGQFWIWFAPRKRLITHDNIERIVEKHPFAINETLIINFPFYSDKQYSHFTGERRRTRQWGRFSVQPSNHLDVPLENQEDISEELTKVIIDKKSKKTILAELNKRGLNYEWITYKDEDDIKAKLEFLNDKILNCKNEVEFICSMKYEFLKLFKI